MNDRIYVDCEFLEGDNRLDLISVALVGADAEYYAVNWDAPWHHIQQHPFLREHVLPQLPLRVVLNDHTSMNFNPSGGWIDQQDAAVKPLWVIRNEVREFVLSYPRPQLWADHAAFDHVSLAWLFGTMDKLPAGFPKRTNDIQQELDRLGRPELQLPVRERPHHALHDARATKQAHEALIDFEMNRVLGRPASSLNLVTSEPS